MIARIFTQFLLAVALLTSSTVASARFIQVDPAAVDPNNVHSFNRYAYGNNNPYRYIDPDGRNPVAIAAAVHVVGGGVAGAFSAGATNAAAQLFMNGNVQWGGIGGVFDAASEGAQIGMVLGPSMGSYAGALRSSTAKMTGDLTRTETRQIQSVVNEAGRPIEVVGSAAAGTRRGVGTNLPIGKGPGTRSDTDYVVPPSSAQPFEGLQGKLPSIDPKTGIIPGVGNTNIGPVIRFEPK